MKIAYLIMTHSMPDHLGRLIHALSDEQADFFVHVDKKVDIEPFLIHRAPNVCFLDRREKVYWGEWQIVEATMHLIRKALESKREYDYMVLLSASCYPIRTKEDIQGILAENRGDQFINAVRMPNVRMGKPLSRLDRFHTKSDQSRLEYIRRVASGFLSRPKSGRWLSKQWWLARDWQRALGSLVPYGGSSWWTLTGEACRYIEAFVRRESAIVRFFENSRVPEEAFFHTILANSEFAPKMRRSLMYTDWSAGGSHPAEISEQHVRMFARRWPLIEEGEFGRGELCFARKFPDDGGRVAGLVDDLVCRYAYRKVE